jgi:hypothetical protein
LPGSADLILVLEAHETAHSTASGARLENGLERPGDYDVNGWPRTIFSPERRSPGRGQQDFRDTGRGAPAAARHEATAAVFDLEAKCSSPFHGADVNSMEEASTACREVRPAGAAACAAPLLVDARCGAARETGRQRAMA